jgi:hypothetical protein
MSRGQDLIELFRSLPLGEQMLIDLMAPLCLVLFAWSFFVLMNRAGIIPSRSIGNPDYKPPTSRAYRDVLGFIYVLVIAFTIYCHFSR